MSVRVVTLLSSSAKEPFTNCHRSWYDASPPPSLIKQPDFSGNVEIDYQMIYLHEYQQAGTSYKK